MPAWKVLLIAFMFVLCLSLATATVIVPLNFSGNERWYWFGGLFVATILAGVLFTLFLRHADRSMDKKR